MAIYAISDTATIDTSALPAPVQAKLIGQALDHIFGNVAASFVQSRIESDPRSGIVRSKAATKTAPAIEGDKGEAKRAKLEAFRAQFPEDVSKWEIEFETSASARLMDGIYALERTRTATVRDPVQAEVNRLAKSDLDAKLVATGQVVPRKHSDAIVTTQGEKSYGEVLAAYIAKNGEGFRAEAVKAVESAKRRAVKAAQGVEKGALDI